MDNPIQTNKLCQNCRSPLVGGFCGECGQQDKEVKRPLLSLLRELLHAVFELDGRAYVTIYSLFTRPAFLAKEYVQGRRARYTPPLRLFLILSISLYFAVTLNTTIQGIDDALVLDPEEVDVVLEESSSDIDLDDPDTDLDEIAEFIEEISLPVLDDEANSNFRRFLITQIQTNYLRIREDPTEFIYGSLEYISFFMLVMMPFLALIQKVLYFRSRRFYIEHLVLTLHNHSFLALCLMMEIVLDAFELSSLSLISISASLLNTGLSIWIIAYLFLSLKVFFSQGYWITALKFITSTIIYAVLLSAGLAVFLAIYFISF